ncbi:hypothetical protein ACTA71_009418 [Dictyostelium dimigraforme]
MFINKIIIIIISIIKGEDIQVLVIDNCICKARFCGTTYCFPSIPGCLRQTGNELEKSLASSLNNQLHVTGRTFNYLCTETPLNPNAMQTVAATLSSILKKSYELLDDQVITHGNEGFHCP